MHVTVVATAATRGRNPICTAGADNCRGLSFYTVACIAEFPCLMLFDFSPRVRYQVRTQHKNLVRRGRQSYIQGRLLYFFPICGEFQNYE